MSDGSGPKAPRGQQLSVTDELMLRQIKPKWFDPSKTDHSSVSSQNFYPASSDEDLLSVDRGSLTTPAASHALLIERGLRSAGVMAVSIAECEAKALKVFDDKETSLVPPNLAHAVVDFRTLSRKHQENKGKALRALAFARGCLHPSTGLVAEAAPSVSPAAEATVENSVQAPIVVAPAKSEDSSA